MKYSLAKIFIIAIIILFTGIMMADTYHVGDGYAYSTIQSAVNMCDSEDDEVIVHSDGDDDI